MKVEKLQRNKVIDKKKGGFTNKCRIAIIWAFTPLFQSDYENPLYERKASKKENIMKKTRLYNLPSSSR